MSITLEQKYENAVAKYRKCQAELKEAKRIMASYDGSPAFDQWDVDIMPSKEWVASCKAFVKGGTCG